MKHTLFHPIATNKVREAEFGNAFFVFDDIKTEGNLYYEDKEYYIALEYYEQAYSCFKWLEFTDPKRRDAILKTLELKPILDSEVIKKEKDYHGDQCEIDTRIIINLL